MLLKGSVRIDCRRLTAAKTLGLGIAHPEADRMQHHELGAGLWWELFQERGDLKRRGLFLRIITKRL